jgi:hypothetical protein
MVDREIFSRRLEALRGYSSKLAAFREVSEAEFVREPAIHGSGLGSARPRSARFRRCLL